MSVDLDTPLRLPCGVELPNRLLKSAMTEGLADKYDRATERHATLYRCWAEGGTGTLITGNVMIDRRFLERPGNVVIDGNGGPAALRRWAAAGTAVGNQLWMQISHPGRQCGRLVSRRPMAPSEIQLDRLGNFGRPLAITMAIHNK
jgi:2,4-dienoyl-CoA reductase-like NADH-dependent reductase (Old Yellow Enzyme family)